MFDIDFTVDEQARKILISMRFSRISSHNTRSFGVSHIQYSDEATYKTNASQNRMTLKNLREKNEKEKNSCIMNIYKKIQLFPYNNKM